MRGMRVSMRGGPGSDDPGLFTCENCAVAGLITRAFDIRDYQLSGPDWMRSTRFNVSAKIAAGTTKEQFLLMIQNLLAERFQMKFHRDQKEMPVLNLVVAKNGPKFRESKPVELSEDGDKRDSGPPKKMPTDSRFFREGKGCPWPS